MSRKPNIDIEKLRESQLMKDEIFKENPELINLEVEKKRKKREEAKQAIIKKINADANQAQKQVTKSTQIKKTPEESFKKTSVNIAQNKPQPAKPAQPMPGPNIRIIKENNEEIQQEKFKETQERLSYTLQMDIISKDQQAAYKKRKLRKKGLDVDDKFKKLTPKITRIYLIVIIVLLVLIAVTLFLIQRWRGF